MATTERAIDRARRRATEDVRALGAEIRRARVTAGLSLREVGSRTGVGWARLSRFDHAQERYQSDGTCEAHDNSWSLALPV